MNSSIFDVFSHRLYRAHVLLDFPDPQKNQPILAFPGANLQKLKRFSIKIAFLKYGQAIYAAYMGKLQMAAAIFWPTLSAGRIKVGQENGPFRAGP